MIRRGGKGKVVGGSETRKKGKGGKGNGKESREERKEKLRGMGRKIVRKGGKGKRGERKS